MEQQPGEGVPQAAPSAQLMAESAQPSPDSAQQQPPVVRLVDARQQLGPARLDDLFPTGRDFRKSVITYTVLLALAGLIAAFGLYQDSVASIIGAMVVAPLGGAIMALAAALVSGRLEWQGITLAQVGLGALMVVAIGFGVSLVIPDPLVLTPSLDARTNPGLLDLGVALAAGAAGAYVAVRRTGSDALPGVAIAVSLVPPLATVGICLELGRLDDAAGALLLFATNFSAIVVVASIVFLLAGVAPSTEELQARRRLRVGFGLALLLMIVAAIPLAWKSVGTVESIVRSNQGAPAVRAWSEQLGLEVTEWSVDGQDVVLHVRGPVEPDNIAPLAAELSEAFGAPVSLEVDYTPFKTKTSTASE